MWEVEEFPETDGGNSCTIAWMYLIPQNCMLKHTTLEDRLAKWMNNQDTVCRSGETHFTYNDVGRLKVKG